MNVAVAVLLCLACSLATVFFPAAVLLMPMVLMYYGFSRGLKTQLGLLLCCALPLYWLGGWEYALAMTGFTLIVAFIGTLCLRKRVAPFDSVCYIAGAIMAGFFVLLALVRLLTGEELVALLGHSLETWVNQTFTLEPAFVNSLYTAMFGTGIDSLADVAGIAARMGEALTQGLRQMLPFYLLVYGEVGALLAFSIVRQRLFTNGLNPVHMAEFSDWRMPMRFAVPAAIITIVGSILEAATQGDVHNIAAIAAQLCIVCFIVQGMAALYKLLKRAVPGATMRAVIVGAAFVLLGQVLSLLGLFDMVFNLRERFSS